MSKKNKKANNLVEQKIEPKKKAKNQAPTPKKKPVKYYAVRRGHQCNVIVRTWTECAELVNGFPMAIYKSFLTEAEAIQFLQEDKKSTIYRPMKPIQRENDPVQLDVFTGTNTPQSIQKRSEDRTTPRNGMSEVRYMLPVDLVQQFESKCASRGLNKEKMLANMLLEWVI